MNYTSIIQEERNLHQAGNIANLGASIARRLAFELSKIGGIIDSKRGGKVPKRFPDIVLAHWSKLIENFQVSPSAFYELLVKAINKREIPNTTIEDVQWSEGGLHTAKREYLRVHRNEFTYDFCAAPFGTGFFISSWLIKTPKNLLVSLLLLVGLLFGSFIVWAIIFAIFNALHFPAIISVVGMFLMVILYPIILLATGVLIREGIIPVEESILELPVVGYLYTLLFHPLTYYRIDSMIMFHETLHNALMEAVDDLTKEKGILALTEEDRKPLLRDFSPVQRVTQ